MRRIDHTVGYNQAMWQKIFVGSKKVHRISMWGAAVFGTPQLITGLMMVWPVLAGGDRAVMRFLREVHVTFAPLFAFFLAVQILTGLLMWLAPKMLAWQRRSLSSSST